MKKPEKSKNKEKQNDDEPKPDTDKKNESLNSENSSPKDTSNNEGENPPPEIPAGSTESPEAGNKDQNGEQNSTGGKKKNKKTKVLGKNVTVVLPGGSSEKAPTVYLTLNKKGKVTEAGFSAPLSSLGYGNVSFSDAVSEEHAVENLMTAAGIPLEEGAVKLPNSKKYRTYAEDGKTISREQYIFAGKNKDAAGKKRAWSCRLNYDYSAANVSGNLADTIRQAYLSVEA